MKWPWRKGKETPPEEKSPKRYCQCCGGIKTRQTTLDEFFPDIFLPEGQKKLTDFDKKMFDPKPPDFYSGFQNWPKEDD